MSRLASRVSAVVLVAIGCTKDPQNMAGPAAAYSPNDVVRSGSTIVAVANTPAGDAPPSASQPLSAQGATGPAGAAGRQGLTGAMGSAGAARPQGLVAIQPIPAPATTTMSVVDSNGAILGKLLGVSTEVGTPGLVEPVSLVYSFMDTQGRIWSAISWSLYPIVAIVRYPTGDCTGPGYVDVRSPQETFTTWDSSDYFIVPANASRVSISFASEADPEGSCHKTFVPILRDLVATTSLVSVAPPNIVGPVSLQTVTSQGTVCSPGTVCSQ
jgi:hypothetical protein